MPNPSGLVYASTSANKPPEYVTSSGSTVQDGASSNSFRIQNVDAPPWVRLRNGQTAQLLQPMDHTIMTDFQWTIRQSLVLFVHQPTTRSTVRKYPPRLGQVAIRCKYCQHLQNCLASSYTFPKSIHAVYQAIQNIANIHFCMPVRQCLWTCKRNC